MEKQTAISELKPRHIKVGNINIGNDLPFVLIAGPDSMESYNRTNAIVSKIKKYTDELGIPWIMKACFDKSQRTSYGSFRGLGFKKAAPLYKRFKKELGVSVTADFSTVEEARQMRGIIDLYQVQSFFSRITDVLVAAGKYGPAVNIKKGQFMSPQDIVGAIGKVVSTGNHNIILTERGYMFGYRNVITDMRSLEIMKRTGYPVCLDVSHTCQLPSAANGASGGEREFSFPLARAGVGVGVAAIFMEVYDKPEIAPVDGLHSFLLSELPDALRILKKLDRVIKGC